MPLHLKNILLAYNGFERREKLATQAISLAEEHGARLHVLHVASLAPNRIWTLNHVPADVLYDSLIEERRMRLEHLATQARKWGIDTRSTIRRGRPDVEIIREAMSIRADLVIVSDHSKHEGRRGGRATTAKLLRECPCPVLASSDTGRAVHHRILAAVQVSPDNSEQNKTNRSVIESAAALAKSAGSKLFVFHCWSLWGEFLLRNNEAAGDDEINEILTNERQDRLQELGLLIASCDLEGVNAEIELQKGDVSELLPRFVIKQDIDLVVMGAEAPSGQRVRIGSVIENAIHELPCSLLLFKSTNLVPRVLDNDP